MWFDDTYIRNIYNFLVNNNFDELIPLLTQLTDYLFWSLQALCFFGFLSIALKFTNTNKGGYKL